MHCALIARETSKLTAAGLSGQCDAISKLQLKPENDGIEASALREGYIQGLASTLLRRVAQVEMPGFHGFTQRPEHILSQWSACTSAQAVYDINCVSGMHLMLFESLPPEVKSAGNRAVTALPINLHCPERTFEGNQASKLSTVGGQKLHGISKERAEL